MLRVGLTGITICDTLLLIDALAEFVFGDILVAAIVLSSTTLFILFHDAN